MSSAPSNLVTGKSYIYFLQCRDSVKIGFTKNIYRRMQDFDKQIPPNIPFRLFALVEGDEMMEKELHRKFAFDCIDGEWFPLSGQVCDFLFDEFFANRLVYFAPVFDVNPDPYLFAPQSASA